MKQTQISSGSFASGNDANGKAKAGNFSGYNAKGERIFIHKAAMESLGFKKQEDVKFPFFACVAERDITMRDENGEVSNPPVLTKRLQALSVFKTAAELISAVNSDQLLNIQAKAALTKEATTAGLTVEAVKALLAEV